MLFRTTSLAFCLLVAMAANSQDTLRNKKGGGYLFTVVKNQEVNPVQNQNKSGTCWSFSALSFVESELKRMTGQDHDLSEMWVVRHAYEDKAKKYVRMHGEMNFGPGGAFHDIPYVIKKYGIVPEKQYEGLNYGAEKHQHYEMDAVLGAMAKTYVSNPNKQLSTAWDDAIEGVLDAYLGKVPEKVEYKGKMITPQEYAEKIGFNMNDYVVLTSYTHHPYYEQFAIEVPDNWIGEKSYNIPLDEMMGVMESSIIDGYTFAWAADVSEKGFSFRDGLAIAPKDESTIEKRGKDNDNFSDAGAEKISSAFDAPVDELDVTQEMRQEAFDNYLTTDDHGMHIVGLVTDQNGKKYFRVKNSWGLDHNDCDGYFYASMPYVRYKTINIMVHKDAISKSLRKKLGIS